MTSYKSCAVAMCKNSTIKNPDKLFIHVPKCVKRRKQWLTLARRNPDLISKNYTMYFCEDHFDLPKDMDNFMEYHIKGSVSQIRMKQDCLPTKFDCHPNKKCTPDLNKSSNKKKKIKSLVKECLKDENLNQDLVIQSCEGDNKVQMECTVIDTSEDITQRNAINCKNYRRRKKTANQGAVKKKKTNSERSRMYRLRKKLLAQEVQSAKEVLHPPSTPSLQMTLEPQPITTETCDKEEYVHDRNQDASEDLRSSDPSHSKDSCSETILTLKKKIKEEFDLLDSQGNDILTHVEIKQEDPEEAEPSVPNFSAPCVQTNNACERESHIEMPQHTMDVTLVKEEPGSPDADAVDSPEEQAIEIKLRMKVEMFNENKEILKRLREEISIFEKKHNELLADIKYLQNVSKKKYKFELT